MEKMTDKLVRFSVTMPESLFSEFEQRVRRSGRKNRSEALRFLVRRYLAEERWRGDEGEVYGTVTLVYNHHTPGLTGGLTETQHRHGDVILCSTHVHVDGDTCLECVLLRGGSTRIQSFIEALRRIRGIKSLESVITSGA